MTTRIVAGIDCTPGSVPVLTWAHRQAELTGAQLEVVSSWGEGLPAAARGHGLDVESALRLTLHEIVADNLPDAAAVRVTEHAVATTPVATLLAAGETADLLVIGSHRHRPGVPMGNVAARVTAGATCPVAVVPTTPNPASTGGPAAGRIVVALDGSPAAAGALEWAARQAQLTGSGLSAVMAWEWTAEYAGHPYDVSPEQIRWECEEDLSTILAALPKSLDLRREVQRGRPADVILAAARGADLLVMGCRGMGAIRSVVLGSVSRQVVHHSRTPVVVTHSADHALADAARARAAIGSAV